MNRDRCCCKTSRQWFHECSSKYVQLHFLWYFNMIHLLCTLKALLESTRSVQRTLLHNFGSYLLAKWTVHSRKKQIRALPLLKRNGQRSRGHSLHFDASLADIDGPKKHDPFLVSWADPSLWQASQAVGSSINLRLGLLSQTFDQAICLINIYL